VALLVVFLLLTGLASGGRWPARAVINLENPGEIALPLGGA